MGSFFKASNGKGAPDGVRGVLKKSADMMVAKSRDIPDTEQSFRGLIETNKTAKLFFVKREDGEEANEKMSKQTAAVPESTGIHQVITLALGEMTFCVSTTWKQIACKCFKKKGR